MPKGGPKTRNIAVCVDTVDGYGRRVIQGLQQGVQGHGDWVLHLFHGPEPLRGAAASGWLHGAVVTVSDASAAVLADCPLPIIGVCGRHRRLRWPIVDVAHAQVGARAADALLACGLASMVCLNRRNYWSTQRIDGFRDRLHGQSPDAHCEIWDEEIDLHRGLRELTLPTGVFALNDRYAIDVINICRSLGIPMPGRVAVLGADNDEILCGMCEPKLSSIMIPFEEIGLAAIRLIVDLWAGRPVPAETLISAVGIAARQSTDLMLIEDELTRRAISACEELGPVGIGARALARRLGVSLRTLERALHAHLHTTPAGLLRQLRLRHAYRLLTTTRMPVGEVASSCGFASFPHFSSVFRCAYGITPSHVRKSEGNRG